MLRGFIPSSWPSSTAATSLVVVRRSFTRRKRRALSVWTREKIGGYPRVIPQFRSLVSQRSQKGEKGENVWAAAIANGEEGSWEEGGVMDDKLGFGGSLIGVEFLGGGYTKVIVTSDKRTNERALSCLSRRCSSSSTSKSD